MIEMESYFIHGMNVGGGFWRLKSVHADPWTATSTEQEMKQGEEKKLFNRKHTQRIEKGARAHARTCNNNKIGIKQNMVLMWWEKFTISSVTLDETWIHAHTHLHQFFVYILIAQGLTLINSLSV